MKKRLTALILAVLLLIPGSTVVSAETALEITRRPENIAAPIGSIGFARVEAEAEGEITYRWFYRDMENEEWIEVGEATEEDAETHEWEGFDTNTLYVPVDESTVGLQLMCVLTDENGEFVESDAVTVGEGLSSELTIEAQPESICAALGEVGIASVTVSAELPASEEETESEPETEEAEESTEPLLSYQWLYWDTDMESWLASEDDGCDSDTVMIPVTEETVGRRYLCLIRTSDGARVETEEITVFAAEPEEEAEPDETPAISQITILAQPADIRAAIGETGTAAVEASADAPLSYQWLYKAKGSAEWKPSGFEGAATDTIHVPVAVTRIGQQYKCVITTEDGGWAETAAVTVLEAEPSVITILTQPIDIRGKLGQIGTAAVVALSDTALSYQWFFKAKNSDTWKASGFVGNDTDTISVPIAATRIGQQYKCVITTADGGRIETDAVTVLEADPSEITILTQPSDIRAKLDQIGTATVEAVSDAALRYQWYYKMKGSSVWNLSTFDGCQTDTIHVPVATKRIGQQYKCVITADDGNTLESDAVTVLEPLPSEIFIETQPLDILGKLDTVGTATVEAFTDTGVELSYQWYFMAKNSDVWKASGFTGCMTDTINVPVAMTRVGQQYKCVITTADGGRAETDVIKVLSPLPSEIVIDIQPEDMYAAIGNNAKATVKALADTSAALSYQWYFKTVGTDEWRTSGMSGSKTPTITVPVTSARLGQQYKCVITTEDGGYAETGTVTICDNSAYAFSISRHPDSYRTYEGDPIELDVSVSLNAGLSYQWYQNGEALAGATDSRLYFSAATPDNAGDYYCVVSGYGYVETSRTATVLVRH